MGYSVVGKSVTKVDALPKAKGAAKYLADLKFPHMLYGKILRSPHAHAKVLSIDTSKAEALRGVEAVLLPEDCPKAFFNMAGFPPGEEFPIPSDQHILTRNPIYVGDPVCAVAAVSEEIAEEAVGLIEVKYEVLPAVFDPEEAIKESAPQFKDGGNVIAKMPMAWGDVAKGFAEADVIVENRYTTQKVYQCSMEPTSCATAMFDDKGKLTIYTPTQMAHLTRRIVAQAMEMRAGDVRIVKPYVGGGFGSRLGTVAEPVAAMLAKKAGKPVQVVYSREESMCNSEQRHPAIIDIKTGVKADGTLVALEMKAIVNTGAYTTHGPTIALLVGAWALSMYRLPNASYEGLCVCTNTMYNGAYRGYANPQAVWAVEQQMDILAEKLNMDPIEIRMKNYLKEGEVWPWSRMEIESCGFAECMKRGLESIDWYNKYGKGKDGLKKRGLGLATMMHVSGAAPALKEISGAFVKLNEDGTANLILGSPDLGQGSTTALMQICAEELGLNYEDIIVDDAITDTDYALFDIGSHASRQMYSGGNAVKKAAAMAKERLLALAADMLKEPVEKLIAKDGQVYVADNPEKSVTHQEVAFEAHFGEIGKQIWGTCSENPPGNPPVYAIHFAEVEVDTETGEVKLLKLVAAHDTGRMINPSNVYGQIQGGVHHGIGMALTEEIKICPETGRVLNPDLANYKIHTILDMPEIDSIAIEAVSKTASHGQKSIGESGLIPTCAAIGNAVYNAIGVRITDLPITPEKVLKALAERK